MIEAIIGLVLGLAGVVGGYLFGRRKNTASSHLKQEVSEVKKEVEDSRSTSQKLKKDYEDAEDDAKKQAKEMVDNPPDDLGDRFRNTLDDLRSNDPVQEDGPS